MSTNKADTGGSTGRSLLWLLLALAGCALWVVTLNGAEPARAWRALLINFLYFSSLAGGLVVWPAVVRTCNGRWHAGIERIALSVIPFAIPSLAALALLWTGSAGWSPWYQERFHQGAWLDNGLLFGRDFVCLLLFWLLAGYYLLQRRHGEARLLAPILILVYCLVFSLLGFDLVMALDPYWHSNLAGGYFFISGLYIAISCWGLVAAADPESESGQRQDIGKLMVAFSMMSTYLMYAHLLPYWYENLPREIRFLVPRMHNPSWQAVSYLLIALVYFGPLVLLLTIKAKRNRWALGGISLLVLAGMWLERWWLVAPTFDVQVRLGLSELSMAVGCIGLLGLAMEQFRRLAPRYLREVEQRGALPGKSGEAR